MRATRRGQKSRDLRAVLRYGQIYKLVVKRGHRVRGRGGTCTEMLLDRSCLCFVIIPDKPSGVIALNLCALGVSAVILQRQAKDGHDGLHPFRMLSTSASHYHPRAGSLQSAANDATKETRYMSLANF